jgi:hypothetical protein
MISFKQFLNERIRTPEQAAKLVDYIGKRTKSNKINLKGYKGASIRQIFKTDWGNIHANQSVPIHKIKWGQSHVFGNTVKKKIQNPSNIKPIVQYLPKTDQYHVIDGTHGIMAKKFMGDKQVTAHVIHNRSLWDRIKGK